MAILKCSMCGSKVHTIEDKFTATCEYCGTEMTIFESTAEFEIDSKGTLVAYNGKGGDIVIPDDIKTIGENCFFENDKIYTVKIPESVKSIKACAFRRCYELERLELPDGLEEIGESAIRGCTSLEQIVLPEGILSIPAHFCCACDSLEKVTIKGNVRRIGEYAFANCPKLVEITLPETVKSLGAGAFSSCKKLESINLSNTVKEMGKRVFEETALKKIRIPDGVTVINNYSFQHCTSLTEVDLNNVEEVGSCAFEGCTELPDVEFKKVKVVRDRAFDNCFSLTKVDTANIETIEDSAMNHCSGIKEVILRDSLRDLGSYAFFNCSQITSVRLPKLLRSYKSPFSRITCKKIYCYNNTPTFELVKPLLFDNLRILTTKDEICKDLEIDESLTYKKQEAITKENEAYNREVNEHGKGLCEALIPFENELKTRNSERLSLNNDYFNKNAALSQELDALSKELDGLGIFSGKRKKELNELIRQKQTEQQDLKTDFDSKDNELHKKQLELENKITPLKNQLNNIETTHKNNLSNIEAKYKGNNNFVGKTLKFGCAPISNPDSSKLIEWKVIEQKGNVLTLDARCDTCYDWYDQFDDIGNYWYKLNAEKWVKATFSTDEAGCIVSKPYSKVEYLATASYFDVTMSIDLNKLLRVEGE